MTKERRILLGRVLGAFGVRGELKLHSFTDPVSTALKYQPWQLVHGGVERELRGVRGRETNKGMVITIPGVDDRDAAEALAGAEICGFSSRGSRGRSDLCFMATASAVSASNGT